MSASAAKALAAELKDLTVEPLEGVSVNLGDDDNLFLWNVAIFGPPDTIYTGGYFKAQLAFPQTYPFTPPEMKFIPSLFHPNVYPDGKICISILHPPGEDEMSGELASERWSPAQRIRTILLSVISLLNEPNTSSPANVDASVAFRDWKEGKSDTYQRRVEAAVEESKAVAAADGVEVPTTLEGYCIKSKAEPAGSQSDWMMEDYDDDDIGDFSDEDGDFDTDDACSPEPGPADPMVEDSGNE
mmetsp:Transcript_9057/g.12694  ORF Transcript_9057/g.12694 Transcript_9057/m.12694 type:complete len:243 (-) Transcript_9057:166-894(-)